MATEKINVMHADGTWGTVYRETPDIDSKKGKDAGISKKSDMPENRYYNPLHPGHVDIFGKDLLNTNIMLYLSNGETIKCKLIGFGQYEILVETHVMAGTMKVIVMKQSIVKVVIDAPL